MLFNGNLFSSERWIENKWKYVVRGGGAGCIVGKRLYVERI